MKAFAATVITDASFCPKTKCAGWAAWVAHDKGRVKKYGAFKRQPKSSAQAELWAAINGITLATREGATDILLQTDCQSVVDLINGQAEKVYQALVLAKQTARPRIVAVHVKGHTRNKESRFWCNRWCDTNAKAVMNAQRAQLQK